MATTARPVAHTGGMGLFIIGTVFYLSFVGLFLWQTAAFVNWLFPGDQALYRVITVCVFDVMALLWACIDTFYRFATKGSHQLVKWAWGVSFIAAMIASVFYMVLQSMTRLDFTPDATYVNIGYGIVILVTVLQILFLTFWIRLEWMTRHPRMNDYEYDALVPPTQLQMETPAPATAPALPAPKQKVLTRKQKREELPIFTSPYADPKRRARIEADLRRQKKQLPLRRSFTPSTPLEKKVLTEEREVAVPAQAPLDPQTEKTPAVPVRKNSGPYKVNRKPAATLPTND